MNNQRRNSKKNSKRKDIKIQNLVAKLKTLTLVDEYDQLLIIQEFLDKKYFENCEFEPVIDLVIFHLLNYATTLPNLINDQLVELFKMLFSHSDHCFFMIDNHDINCKINLQLYRSNWLKVYFESVCKVKNYNLNEMCDQMIEFMFVMFNKTSNPMARNLDYVPALDHLVFCTQLDLGKKEKQNATILTERKRKIILLIILILDGQYQPFLTKRVLDNTLSFLDNAGIRMYWENLNEFKDVKNRIDSILKYCKTLIEAENDMKDLA